MSRQSTRMIESSQISITHTEQSGTCVSQSITLLRSPRMDQSRMWS